MRVLLDESLPRGLAELIEDHEISTVVDEGWAGMRNGELLERAAVSFDAFVTADQNLPHQQPLERFDLTVIVLAGRTNRLSDLAQLVPDLQEALAAGRPGVLRQG